MLSKKRVIPGLYEVYLDSDILLGYIIRTMRMWMPVNRHRHPLSEMKQHFSSIEDAMKEFVR